MKAEAGKKIGVGAERPACDMGNGLQSADCGRRFKRRKVEEGRELEDRLVNSGNSRHWSVISAEVGPDIMQDMGVGKLAEEELGQVEKPGNASEKSSKACMLATPKTDCSDSAVSEEFVLLCKRRHSPVRGEDLSEKLSDEIILMIFHMLPKKVLVRSALVCKRWLRIAYDESLWSRLDLSSKVLKPGSMGHILQRGVLILRLAQADIKGPVFSPGCPLVEHSHPCKVQYLDLSMAVITDQELSTLLKPCRFLHKLSLEHCTVNEQSCSYIGENVDLEVLNMSACYGLTDTGLDRIFTGCKRLAELNLAWTHLNVAALQVICKSLPASLQRLNLSGCKKYLVDGHVRHIVRLCPNLIELDLSDSTNLTANSVEYICLLSKLEHVAFSRCYSIPAPAYMLLSTINSLMYIDVIGLFGEQVLIHLEQNLPHISINKFHFSSVARPTVGVRRTSIWGLRVRQ